jgi:hypothetical protein
MMRTWHILAAIPLVMLSACSPVATTMVGGDSTLFLTENAPAAVQMEALYRGRVSADASGCIRLETQDVHTVVWPHGFTLRDGANGLAVHDATGRRIGRLGDDFAFGGGEIITLHDGVALPADVRQIALQRCPGRYWIVGAVQ